MKEYIEKAALYKEIAEMEEMARERYLDTQWDSPARGRYETQMNERTRFKHMIADFPTASIEDILGIDYDLNRLRELVEADRDGRCVVLPCHIGDPVFMGTGLTKITGYEEDVCDGFYIGRDGVLQVKSQCYKGNHGTYGIIGQTAELNRESAEAALKKEETP